MIFFIVTPTNNNWSDETTKRKKQTSITLFNDTWKDEIIKFQTNNKKIIDGTVVFLFILTVISLSEVVFLFLGCF